MKIIVLDTLTFSSSTYVDEVADRLVCALHDLGFDSEAFKIPTQKNGNGKLPDEMLLNRLLRFSNTHRIIALRFPAYLAPFDNKVIWLCGQWDSAYGSVEPTDADDASCFRDLKRD